MAAPPLDPRLAREAWEAVQDANGVVSEAARRLGIPRATLRHRLDRHEPDPAIAASMKAVGTNMTPALAWAKVPAKDGEPGYSVLLKPQEAADDMLERVRAAFEGMEPAAPVVPPDRVMADLCTVYPLMDVHFGMLAWGRETGVQDYDIQTATADMRHAFAKVSALTPASESAVLLIGGDFFHADDNRSETPGSKHKLDTDGRHFKVLDCGIALVAETVERLALKHRNVTIRVLRGNHDEHAHMVLTFALSERYREEPRVTVEKTPLDLFMMRWGRTLISAHHGDKAPPERLTLYLSDICPYWSDTRHRYCLTGHIHHDKAKDTGPLRWESLRAFCPSDSYAAGMGYASRRALQAITFCKRDGLVLRALDPIERAA